MSVPLALAPLVTCVQLIVVPPSPRTVCRQIVGIDYGQARWKTGSQDNKFKNKIE
jgi:hypothetical protein